MLIPIRCFTCGRVLADKYIYFQKKRKALLHSENAAPMLDKGDTEDERVMGTVLDELELNLMCCRRTMLSHVDIDRFV